MELIAPIIYKQWAQHPAWPFVIAAAAAVVFGWIGLRGRGAWLLWALAGAVFGLFTASLISGLADATALPYTDVVKSGHQAVALVISILIVAIIGFLLAVGASGGLLRFRIRPKIGSGPAQNKPG